MKKSNSKRSKNKKRNVRKTSPLVPCNKVGRKMYARLMLIGGVSHGYLKKCLIDYPENLIVNKYAKPKASITLKGRTKEEAILHYLNWLSSETVDVFQAEKKHDQFLVVGKALTAYNILREVSIGSSFTRP